MSPIFLVKSPTSILIFAHSVPEAWFSRNKMAKQMNRKSNLPTHHIISKIRIPNTAMRHTITKVTVVVIAAVFASLSSFLLCFLLERSLAGRTLLFMFCALSGILLLQM